jgi:hypothetical protein
MSCHVPVPVSSSAYAHGTIAADAYQDSSMFINYSHLPLPHVETVKGHHNGTVGIQRLASESTRALYITHHCTAFTSCNKTCPTRSFSRRPPDFCID